MAQAHSTQLAVAVAGDDYQRGLISCQVACPVHTDARGYVRAIAAGNFEEAYLIARGPNPFASICGRICGAPCEAACRRGKVPRVDDDGRFVAADRPISIRALKRFVCDQFGPEARPTDDVLTPSAITCRQSAPPPRKWPLRSKPVLPSSSHRPPASASPSSAPGLPDCPPRMIWR